MIDVVIDNNAVAPVTACGRASRRERVVLDSLDEIAGTRARDPHP